MSLDETAPLTSLCWGTPFITVPSNREGSQITSPSGMSELVLCYMADVGLLVSWGLQREHPRPLALTGEQFLTYVLLTPKQQNRPKAKNVFCLQRGRVATQY